MRRPHSPFGRRRAERLTCTECLPIGLIFLCCAKLTGGACEYGKLAGTMLQTDEGSYDWHVYEKNCQLDSLTATYLGLLPTTSGGNEKRVGDWPTKDMSMLLLGDSVDRSTIWDVNETAWGANSKGLQSLLNEHWRVALKLPHLEMVYQFTPGSHTLGPYHDDVPWNMTIVNALPRGFELHKLLTGRERPNVVVFSNMLWDLGRWLFLSEIAEPERMDHFGKPLLREQEFLPSELLDEWRQDTELQLQRIERLVDPDALLIYHNAAFAKLADCKNGTEHIQKGMGKRTHLVQLNALARQVISENSRWHLVDLGAMSESFLSGSHLRDEHHPKREFLLQVMNIYYNLQQEFGTKPRPITRATGNVPRWDAEYSVKRERAEANNLAETQAENTRLDRKREMDEKERRARKSQKSRLNNGYKMLLNLKIG